MSNRDCRVIDKNFLQLVQIFHAIGPDCDKPELLKKLLDINEDFDINYKISDSHDIFDTDWVVGQSIFSLINKNTELCQILIDRGADYTVTDKEGSTVLHVTACSTLLYSRSFYKFSADLAAYANIILSAHIKSANPKNPKNKTGLSHFHIACMFNHTSAVKYFLDNGICVDETVNNDSKFHPGFTALHFAVLFCALETVEILLEYGANMFIKDLQGMNPLHILLVGRRIMFVELQGQSRIPPPNLNISYNSNLQKYYNDNQKLIHRLLERMKGCYNHAGSPYFHFLCFAENTSVIKQFLDHHEENLTESMPIDLPIWPGYTPLHFSVISNMETMELLIRRGADLDVKDASGATPLDICLRELNVVDLDKIFSLHPHYSNTVFSDGKTKLSSFFQAMRDAACFESFLNNHCIAHDNIFVPFNSALCAGHSPLHLAVICAEQPGHWDLNVKDPFFDSLNHLETRKSPNYLLRIDLCLKYNSDVTAKDATGSTPLHWAFRLQQRQAVHRLLDRHESTSNIVDDHGLSHLHIACAANNRTVLKKILDAGANVNEVAASTYFWLRLDNDLAENMRALENYEYHSYFFHKGSTPLHFAATVKCPEIVQILIDHGADPLAQDFDGFNPLERLFQVPIFRDSKCLKPNRSSYYSESEKEIIKILVRKIGDILAQSKPNQMLYCYSLLDDNFLAKILDYGDESASKILESVGITALHVACITRNLQQVLQLVDKIDVNARVSLDSPLRPGCSPLHILTYYRYRGGELHVNPSNTAILDELLQRGADVAAENAKGETPLHQIFKMGFVVQSYTEKMLEHLKNFSVNPISRTGSTHLHIASYCGNAIAVRKLLEQGAKIEQPSNYFSSYYCGYAAIHFAAVRHRTNVIDVLLTYGADCNQRNGHGENSLHTAIIENDQPSIELLQTLIRAGADIYAKKMDGSTPFEALIKWSNRIDAIKIFLDLGYPVNTINPISGEGLLALALKKSQTVPIFDKLVQALDLEDIIDNGINAIHNVVSFERPEAYEYDELEIEKDYTPTHQYTRAIGLLMKLGMNIDHKNCSGLTPLHMAAKMQNLTGIVGLLENGADINIVDSSGKPAFAYSLELARLRREFSELDILILEVILAHIYKLNLAGIEISTSNRVVEAKIREIYSLEVTKTEESASEMEKMRNEQINSQPVTFYELLSDIGLVTDFPYYLLRKKTAIACIFNDEIESLREKFPEFAGILILQYRKASTRDIIINDAMVSLNILLGFNLPAICLKMILKFLNNDGLNTLIKSTTIG